MSFTIYTWIKISQFTIRGWLNPYFYLIPNPALKNIQLAEFSLLLSRLSGKICQTFLMLKSDKFEFLARKKLAELFNWPLKSILINFLIYSLLKNSWIEFFCLPYIHFLLVVKNIFQNFFLLPVSSWLLRT